MSARTLTAAKITMKVEATTSNVMDDGVASTGSINGNIADSISTGAEANQANRAWQYKDKLLGSGASITIDLFDVSTLDVGAGPGNDNLGQSMSPIEEIVSILIKNENAVTAAGTLEIIPASSNGWAPIGSHTDSTGGGLLGQGALMKYQPAEAGFDVPGAATNSRITLTANGGAITYSIYFLARHDDSVTSSSSSSSSSSSLSSSSSSGSSSSVSTSSSSSSVSTSSESSSSESSSSSVSTSSVSSPSSSSPSSASSSISTSSESSSSSVSSSSQSSSSESSSSISTSSSSPP